MYLTQQEILNSLQGRCVMWAENHVRVQKEKYGNEDIFEAIIEPQEITFYCGESQGVFKYDESKQKWEHDSGNLYHSSMCREMVNQLAKKFLQDENTEYCKPQTLRYKVSEFMMSDPNLCVFRGEKYFEVEDALVDFINTMIIIREKTKDLFVLTKDEYDAINITEEKIAQWKQEFKDEIEKQILEIKEQARKETAQEIKNDIVTDKTPEPIKKEWDRYFSKFCI